VPDRQHVTHRCRQPDPLPLRDVVFACDGGLDELTDDIGLLRHTDHRAIVCTENPIRIYPMIESPKLAK
jgi:hypothetical protein